MVIFACLLCDEEFPVSNAGENNYGAKGCAVLTSCGHYFHLFCLEKALVQKKETTASEDKRKLCPICQENLHKPLTKINPLKFGNDKPDQNINTISKRGNGNRTHFETGDRVAYKTTETEDENFGTVSRVFIEIEPDNQNLQFTNHRRRNASLRSISGNQLQIIEISNPKKYSVNIPVQNVKLIHSLQICSSQESISTAETYDEVWRTCSISSDSGISEAISEVAEMRLPAKAYSDCRPKWIAGERIYLPQENEFARITWIGARDLTFMVVIEYDHPIDHQSFESHDLPFKIEQKNVKKYRRLKLDELNQCAQKASNSSSNGIKSNLTRFRKWGSERLTSARRPFQLFIDESQRAGPKRVSRPTSSGSLCTSLMMGVAEFKISKTEKATFLGSQSYI